MSYNNKGGGMSFKQNRNSGQRGGSGGQGAPPVCRHEVGGQCAINGGPPGFPPVPSPTNTNNNIGSGTAATSQQDDENLLRHQFLTGCSNPPPKCVEREVDRLLGCAKNYCEKEKFKLKQYYEEELVKKKRIILSEFRCALEREVIAPLKQRLCEYEREVYELRQQLLQCGQRQSSTEAGTDTTKTTRQSVSLGEDAFDQLEHIRTEMEAVEKEKKVLAELVVKEKERKKISKKMRKKMLGLKDEEVEVEDDVEPGSTQTTASEPASNDVRINMGEGTSTSDEKMELTAVAESVSVSGSMPIEPEQRKSRGMSVDMGPYPENATEAIKALLKRIRYLTKALDDYKGFSQQQIDDLIKEGEIMEKWYDRAMELEKENEELKRIIEDLMRQLQALKPAEGTEEADLAEMRKKIADLEGLRTRGSMQGELDELKGQLEEMKKLRDEAEAKAEADDVSSRHRKTVEWKKELKEGPAHPPPSKEEHEALLAPYEAKIEELKKRIKELEDMLVNFNDMKNKLKEMEDKLKELEDLKAKYAEKMAELEKLKNQTDKDCPKVSTTELNDLKKKHEDAEKNVQDLKAEHDKVLNRLAELQAKNDELMKTIDKMKNLEAENEKLKREIADLEQKLKDLQAKLFNLQKENERLSKEVNDLKAELLNHNKNEMGLENQVRRKTSLLSELHNTIDALRRENERLKKELEDLKLKLDKSEDDREKMRKELDDARKLIDDTQKRLKAEEELAKANARKCDEECGLLSKKGQCILQHEKKSIALAGQLEADNAAIRDRLKQLEEQLEAMANMENRTRAIHREMGELQARARDRSKKLEELQNIGDCDVKGCVETEPGPGANLPPLPVPSMFPADKTESTFKSTLEPTKRVSVEGKPSANGGADPEPVANSASKTEGKEGWMSREFQQGEADQCLILSKQLEELEKQRAALNAELERNLKGVDDLNKILSQVNTDNLKLTQEKDKACRKPE